MPGLAGAGSRRLQELLQGGQTPDPAALAGWEYRGVNMPPTVPRLLGIRRFIKGFLSEPDGQFLGYNRKVAGAGLDQPWITRPAPGGRATYAPFAVRQVETGGVDGRYRNAILFDYGAPPEPEAGVAARLRDYVVRVVPDSDDLLLGRAFLVVGRRRLPVGWFAIQRAHRIDPPAGRDATSSVVPAPSPRTVTLRDEHDGADSRWLGAYVDAGGALHIDGHDIGPGTASVSGDGEYEWFKTVAAGDVPRLVAVLGGEEGDDVLDLLAANWTGPRSYDFERALRESGILVTLSTWSG